MIIPRSLSPAQHVCPCFPGQTWGVCAFTDCFDSYFSLVTASLTKPTFWVERCFSGMAWLRNSKSRVSKNVCRPQVDSQSLGFKKRLLEEPHDLGCSVEPGLWRPDGINSTCQSEPSCVWYPTAHFPVIDDEAEVRLVQPKPGQGVPQCWASPCNCGPTDLSRFGSKKSSYVQVGRLGFSRLGMKEHIYQGPSHCCLPFCNYSGSMPDSFLCLISRHKSAFGSPEPGWLIEFC